MIIIVFRNGFQSTHPHGVRHKISMRILKNSVFQSTHPHGVRHIVANELAQMRSVSIHAPTRGATSTRKTFSDGEWFQSTHPHGVRLSISNSIDTKITCFNPRTHTGCDNLRSEITKSMSRFNPRTHTGCDQTAIKLPYLI